MPLQTQAISENLSAGEHIGILQRVDLEMPMKNARIIKANQVPRRHLCMPSRTPSRKGRHVKIKIRINR